MQLEHLCDIEWRYELWKELQQRDGRDGRVYGEGEGEGEGEGRFSGRLSGVARWSNFPRLHDGYARPDAPGVPETTDRGLVSFALTGLSDLTDGAGVHVMTSMRYYFCTVDYRPTIPATS